MQVRGDFVSCGWLEPPMWRQECFECCYLHAIARVFGKYKRP